MRFMIFVKASKTSETGAMPSPELLAAMGKFNEKLAAAGVLKDFNLLGGLHPTSKAARVTFSGVERTVTKGPFPNPNELVAGFWLWECKSLDEAIEWAKRVPNPMPEISDIEIRPLFEMEDFAPAQ